MQKMPQVPDQQPEGERCRSGRERRYGAPPAGPECNAQHELAEPLIRWPWPAGHGVPRTGPQTAPRGATASTRRCESRHIVSPSFSSCGANRRAANSSTAARNSSQGPGSSDGRSCVDRPCPSWACLALDGVSLVRRPDLVTRNTRLRLHLRQTRPPPICASGRKLESKQDRAFDAADQHERTKDFSSRARSRSCSMRQRPGGTACGTICCS